MNWFEYVMDSCKESVSLCTKNTKLFLPNIISLLITGLSIIISVVVLLIFGFSSLFNVNDSNFQSILFSALPLIIFLLVIFGILLPTVYCMIEAGVLFMCRNISLNGTANMSDFFKGVKKYWLQVLIGLSVVSLFFIMVYLLGFIFITLGEILTLGYGFAIVWVLLNIFYGTWGVIMVAEDIPALDAIKRAYQFGKKNFWALFTIFFIPIPIIPNISAIIGAFPLVGLLVVPLVGILINTYFKLVLYIFYVKVKEKEKKEDFGIDSSGTCFADINKPI